MLIRLEISPKDMRNDVYVVFRRDTCVKSENQPKASVVQDVKELLDEIQSLFDKCVTIIFLLPGTKCIDLLCSKEAKAVVSLRKELLENTFFHLNTSWCQPW